MYKELYVVQPYRVGSKEKTSLAVILPSKLVKEHGLGISTVLAVRFDKKSNNLLLRPIDVGERDNKNMLVGQRFEPLTQQASEEVH